MNISYNWLKEYVSFDLEPEKVSEILTDIGLEVEDMEMVEDIPGGLEGVVVASVLECENHPDSDHLHITMVSIGEGEPLQVVCGASNIKKGQKVLLATVGTKLPTSDGSEFKIKKSKIRGAESFGMICAEDELGIGSSHDGIMVLEDTAVPGTPAREYLNLGSDLIFTIGLTPNRVDAASHMGVARDLSAYLKLNKLGGELSLPSIDSFKEGEGKAISLRVESSEGSARYVGITLENVKVAPSPDWLMKRLNSIGVRPINNVVDITNYVLHETGQPLHAFDASKIEGGEVVVRLAKDGERFTTLDEVERELSPEDLMICNTKAPMCIAGVFGGLDSGVTQGTTSVFLESAYFNSVFVRKTSKRHTLKTDASFRFERGADPNMVIYAAKRAVLLMQELSGATVVGKIQENYPSVIERKKVSLDFERMERLFGKKIGAQTITDILTYLDFEFISNDGNTAEVLVPTYRVDVYRECDVIEEVLRVYGYNNIEFPENIRISVNTTPHPDPEIIRGKASDLLVNNGFIECMNNSLTRGEYYTGLKTYPSESLVNILNPLSSDLNSMRQTLLFSGMEVIAYNLNRQATDIKIFEIGNIYRFNPENEGGISNHKSFSEQMHLSMFLTGKGAQYWSNKLGVGYYFTLKGYLELLLKRFGISLYNFEAVPAPSDLFSEGVEYRFNGKVLAVIGTVKQSVLKQFGIKLPVFAAEVSWDIVLDLYKRNKIKYKELPKFPEVKRDLALLLDEKVSFGDIRKAAFATEKRLLKNIILFDVYRGDKIPQGKKQYAISFLLQDLDKTLTDKYVDIVMNKLLDTFIQKFGATLR